MLAALGACATVAPPKTVEAPSDVSCSLFATISYAMLPAGVVDDPGNKADSDATRAEIDRHNAKWDTICGDPLKPG